MIPIAQLMCRLDGMTQRSKRVAFIAALLSGVFLHAGQLRAQTPEDSLKRYLVDFAPPDLCAFALLGVNPSQVARPASIKELAFGFVNGTNSGGGIAPDIAIDWSPFESARSSNLTDYRKSYWKRATQVTFGSSKDSVGTRVAVGLRWVPIDKSDPLNDEALNREVLTTFTRYDSLEVGRQQFNRRVHEFVGTIVSGSEDPVMPMATLEAILDPANPPSSSSESATFDLAMRRFQDSLASLGLTPLSGDALAKLRGLAFEYSALVDKESRSDSEVAKDLKAVREAFKKRSWNASIIHAAIGVVWSSSDDSWKRLKTQAARGYLGGATGLGRFGQVVLQVDGTWSLDDSLLAVRRFSAGTRVLIGNKDYRVSLEGLQVWSSGGTTNAPKSGFAIMFGGEAKVTNELFLQLGLGKAMSTREGEGGKITTSASLQYAFGHEAH